MQPREILDRFLGRLWADYRQRVPYADRYAQLVTQQGGTVANDHLAFRTFNCAVAAQPAGFTAIERVFKAFGYERAGEYDFPQMNLQAVHLEHAADDLPRIFISQLEVERLEPAAQELIVRSVQDTAAGFPSYEDLAAALAAPTQADAEQLLADLHAFFARPWPAPLRSAVEQVNDFAQYAAWTLLHGNAVNHFTAYINRQDVADWPDIEATIAGLQEAGVPMKDKIEGDRGTKLRQSSTRAAEGEFDVVEDDGSPGKLNWTYAYYELAERGMVDTPDGPKLFTGFLGPQTPGLFEMTRK